MTPVYYNNQDRVDTMSAPTLRALWQETFGQQAPKAYPASLLAKKLQMHLKMPSDDLQERIRIPSQSKLIKYHPMPGVTRSRRYKGKLYVVQETANGLLFNGEIYDSYSAVTKEITKQRRNGLKFFGVKPNVA